MDGSTLSLIAIPVVVTISLAAWLIMVSYAASHPSWRNGPAARNASSGTAAAPGPARPAPGLRSLPGPDGSTPQPADSDRLPAPDSARAA
jgi:hypothetical protein